MTKAYDSLDGHVSRNHVGGTECHASANERVSEMMSKRELVVVAYLALTQ